MVEIFARTRFDFLRHRRLFSVLSALGMAAGVLAVLVPGQLEFGIDFSGGSQLIVELPADVTLEQVRGALLADGLSPWVQQYGSPDDHLVLIKIAAEPAAEAGASRGAPAEQSPGVAVAAVRSALERDAGLGDFRVLGQEYVGPQVGSELRTKSVLAVVFSTLGILLYLWFRFELRFAVGTVVAMVHDVLVTLAFYVLAGFELDLTTVAAFLTLVGYSVNDTVVIFDRVRENLRQRRREPPYELFNQSLNETLSRTVMTSGTTLLAAGSLLVAGGPALRGFAFVLTVGVVVGTYSSIYVASPIALLWAERSEPGLVDPASRSDHHRPSPPSRTESRSRRRVARA